uniref:Uncharacterized protein n=1 Tax=Avena sativa TaxID=4498 RepID=A0ACD5XN29_AVESA
MDTSKRRRSREDDDAADRLFELPDGILHDLLSRIGPHQAVQTSVLSRRWRHLWREVLRANVIIDEREFAGVQWERFEDFADQALLSIPPEKKLDFFHLNLVRRPEGSSKNNPTFETSDRWIRRGLRHCPAAVDIRTAHEDTICWRPHWSYFSAPSPQPDLSACGLSAAGFTGRLATLRLLGVDMWATAFLEDLGRYCPVLEDLHVERCRMLDLTTVASPTLRSLAIVEPRRPLTCAHLRIVAPLLARLRLELAYDGYECHCVAEALDSGRDVPPQAQLPLITDASIQLTDTSSFDGQANQRQRARKKRKLEFLKSMRGLVALLPDVIKLQLAGFTTMALIEEEFPVLHCLKILILERCDIGVESQALTGILPNTPDLENLGLHHCTFLGPPAKKRRNRSQQPSKRRSTTPYDFWSEKLKSIKIKQHQQDESQIAKVLAKISERMQPELWRQVTISSTIV